ncbi:MAG: alanine racemase [Candidatus Dormiibacterota bacterium]
MPRLDLEDVLSEPIDWRYKSFPQRNPAPRVRDVPSLAWNALAGDFSFPVLTLKDSALQHNIDLMAVYCHQHGVSLAPHTKTPLSPQIASRQLEAGAFALSVATIHQARVLRASGASRILLANQLLERESIDWVSRELRSDPAFEFTSLIDSVQGLQLVEAHLAGQSSSATRKWRVLLEMGMPGGRCGCRSIEEALALAEAIASSAHVELVGVETYENIFNLDAFPQSLGRVDTMLGVVRELMTRLDSEGRFAHLEEVLVSAGGSIYFDRVVADLVDWRLTVPVRTVLRSGSYVTQDAVYYGELSPLGGRAESGPTLRQALELWAMVISRPEPELVILGFGKRDAPHDRGFPIPFALRRRSERSVPTTGLTVLSLNDHHARCAIAASEALDVGDLVGLYISHPCTTFDNWRLVPLVDDEYGVLDAIRCYL